MIEWQRPWYSFVPAGQTSLCPTCFGFGGMPLGLAGGLGAGPDFGSGVVAGGVVVTGVVVVVSVLVTGVVDVVVV